MKQLNVVRVVVLVVTRAVVVAASVRAEIQFQFADHLATDSWSSSSSSGGGAVGNAGSTGWLDSTDVGDNGGSEHFLVDVGGCAGVLIAPTFLLTSASCVQDLGAVVERVAVWGNEKSSVEIRVLAGGMSVHPSFAAGEPEFDFAVVELRDAAPSTPVVLSYTDLSWRETLGDLDEDLRVYPRRRRQQSQDAARQEIVPASPSVLAPEHCDLESATLFICTKVKQECQDLAKSSSISSRGPPSFLGFPALHGDSTVHIVGMSTRSLPCRDGEHGKDGFSSTNVFVSVSAVRSFIDKRSVGHRWQSIEQTDSDDGSISSSTSPDHPSDENYTEPNVPEWIAGEFPQLGYIAMENDTRVERGALPVVLIAPKFGLSRVQWLRESAFLHANQSLRAEFSAESLLIKRLIFQTETHLGFLLRDNSSTDEDPGGNLDDDLVVIELEREATMTSPLQILRAIPRLNVVLPDIDVKVLEAVDGEDVSNSRGVLKFPLLSDCHNQLSNEPNDSLEYLCAQVPLLIGQVPPSSVSKAVLSTKTALIGFPTSSREGANVSADERCARYSFTRLAFERHASFLTNATQSTVVWSQDGFDRLGSSGTGVEEGEFPSFIASFYSDAQKEPLRCQGMLVAPKVVLTTASCVLRNNISEVGLPLPYGKAIRVPVLPQQTIVHPRYNVSSSSQEIDGGSYDVAILQLGFATTVSPATLSLGGLTEKDDPVGFEFPPRDPFEVGFLSEPADRLQPFRPTTFNRSDKCSMLKATNFPSSLKSSICLTPCQTPTVVVSDHNSTQTDDPTHLKRGIQHQSSPSLIGSVFGKQMNSSYSLVGFAVTHEVEDEDIYSVSNLADAAVFINAYVVGASWEAGGVLVDGPLQLSKRYIVGLRVSKYGQNFCGGSLIAPSYVLTAAHCVTDGLAKYVSVGSKDSSGKETEAIGVIQESIVIHQSYGTPYKFSFDAAIVELKASAYATPVVLDQSPDFSDGERATMYGYGGEVHASSATSESVGTEIRAVDLSLLSQAQCMATLPDIDNSMLCAVGKDGEDACKGDSGGPLVVPKALNNDGDVLVGVVSSGYECGLKDVPGIYMRVSSLSGFISDNTVGAEWGYPVTQLPTPSVTPTPTKSSSDSELRDLDSLSPRESASVDGSSTAGGDLGTSASLSSDRSTPIRFVNLPGDLKPQIRRALLQYLLGISDSRFISSKFLTDLASEANQLRLYSSGDLAPILAIIKRHNELPLYARKDRFGRQRNAAVDNEVDSGSSSPSHCTS